MNIQHEQKDKRGHFFVRDGETLAAEMTYVQHDPETIIIDHTEVSAALQGKNVGYALVEAAAEYARTNNLKIIPACSFAAAVFQKKQELRDVLKEE
ncbi:MAG: N-acetyltransferase [Chitinophagaceae bacterium]|nr:MAG: N-acetyltransferase [Chitinophagaceae bacterium]